MLSNPHSRRGPSFWIPSSKRGAAKSSNSLAVRSRVDFREPDIPAPLCRLVIGFLLLVGDRKSLKRGFSNGNILFDGATADANGSGHVAIEKDRNAPTKDDESPAIDRADSE